MVASLVLLNLTFLVAAGAAGLFLLWWPFRRRAPASPLDRWAAHYGAWLSDWRLLTAIAAAVYAAVVAFDLQYQLYACSNAAGASDALAYLASGRAFLTGGNPFSVANCGGTVVVPYGLSVVLVNAVGSLGGLPGVVLLWGAVTVALLPLTWWIAGPDRRYVTLVVATSLLFLPLAVSQIDGASNLLVPVAVLLALGLARRGGPLAAAAGGVLASGRFPSLFPTVGASTRFARPVTSAFAAVGAFVAVTGATYLAYGRAFIEVVFTGEIGRRSFSLNLYGVLLHQGWLPGGDSIAVLQATLTILLVGVVAWRARTALGAAAITLVGIALLSQFLSFNILAWLLPVALLGARPRGWLWAVGVVGTLNYTVGFSWLGNGLGIWWPFELLDVVLTALLLLLFVDAWKADSATSTASSPPRAAVGLTTS